MYLYNQLKKHSILDTKFCHSYIKGKCNLLTCRYDHPCFTKILMIDDENTSETPCSFILESNGCAMNIPKRGEPMGSPLRLKSCELDNRRNHFFRPKFVCEQCFYDSSKTSPSLIPHKCHKLHISWKNFVRNMFNSKVDNKKQKCINFIIGIVFNLVCQEEDTEFDKILKIHNKLINIYKEQYSSKCIKCGLPPYRFKLWSPKCFSIFILHRSNVCIDLSKIVSEYMYPKHKKLDNMCYNCLFIKPINLSNTSLSCITFMGLSKISLYGDRVVSLYPLYSIAIKETNKHRYTESINGPDLDKYDKSIRDQIWKLLIDNIP